MDYKDAKKVLELCERATLGHDGDDGDSWFDDYLTEVDAELIAITRTVLPYWVDRACQLEAEAAAMQEALGEARDLYECAYYEGFYARMGYKEEEQKWASNAKKILTNMKQALAPDAGKDLLEKVQKLEAEAAAMREALEKIAYPIPWLQTFAENKGYVLNGSAAVYLAKDANWLKDTAKQALSPDAGKALLERVQKLEAIAEAVAEAAKAIGDELGDCQCGNA